MKTFKMCSLILCSLHHGAKNDTYVSVLLWLLILFFRVFRGNELIVLRRRLCTGANLGPS